MKIYGVHDIKDNEQCIRVGTLPEIIKFFSITARETTRMLKKCRLRGKYEVVYIYTE